MCQETFRTPALWVRHIQTHELGSITDLPKRKRRKTTVRILYICFIYWYASIFYVEVLTNEIKLTIHYIGIHCITNK